MRNERLNVKLVEKVILAQACFVMHEMVTLSIFHISIIIDSGNVFLALKGASGRQGSVLVFEPDLAPALTHPSGVYFFSLIDLSGNRIWLVRLDCSIGTVMDEERRDQGNEGRVCLCVTREQEGARGKHGLQDMPVTHQPPPFFCNRDALLSVAIRSLLLGTHRTIIDQPTNLKAFIS